MQANIKETIPESINSGDDTIDIRDVIARFEYLENRQLDDKEADDEFNQLESLLSDLKGKGGDHDWRGNWYPVTLIAESHFAESMDEMLQDIGDMPKDIPNYLKITVDYDMLKMDYSEVEFDGETFLYR